MMRRRAPARWALIRGLTTLPVLAVLGQAMGEGQGMNEELTFEPPTLEGTVEKGTLTTELYRGASVPDELLVIETPGDCQNHIDVEIEWSKDLNYVDVHLSGKNALDPHPKVLRDEGEDYFSNEFWPEVEDVHNGRYLLWLIHPIERVEFYYDSGTLDLLGSEYDEFEVPLEGAITVRLPAFVAVPTGFIDVENDGDVDFVHTFEYDGLVRGDQQEFAHTVASFIPHTLCKAHPTDYTQTTTRPYTTAALPASAAKPFSEYLRNGLIFDITVEPKNSTIFPPRSTNIATYSQALTVAGGIPEGWTNDLEAIFANLAPPIRRWEAGETCTNWFKPMRVRDYVSEFDICAASEEGDGQ